MPSAINAIGYDRLDSYRDDYDDNLSGLNQVQPSKQ